MMNLKRQIYKTTYKYHNLINFNQKYNAYNLYAYFSSTSSPNNDINTLLKSMEFAVFHNRFDRLLFHYQKLSAVHPNALETKASYYLLKAAIQSADYNFAENILKK